MDEFLKRILPADGDYAVVAIHPVPDPVTKKKKIFEVTARDLAGVTNAVRRLSTKPLDIYVAIGSYNKGSRKDPKSKQSMYLDLDGKDFEGGKAAGMRELVRFCKATALPAPAIVVDSGGGFHCYWPFNQEIAVGPWRALATALKTKCAELGFKADPTVTADAARILRVPTTMNYKYNPPLPCRVMQDNGAIFDPAALMQVLMKSASGLLDGVFATKKVAPIVNNELSGGLDYEKPDADTVRSMMPFCNLPASQGRLMWLEILQGLNDWDPGEEGFTIAHDWSATQPSYKSEGDVRKIWLSIKGTAGRVGRTIGTVIRYARQGGWKPAQEPEPEQPAAAVMLDDLGEAGALDDTSYSSRVSSAISKLREKAVEAATAAGRTRAPPKDMEKILADQFIYVKNQDTYYNATERALWSKESIRDIHTPDMARSRAGVPMDPTDVLRRSAKKMVVDSMGFHPGEGAIYSERGKDYVNRHTEPPPELVPTPAEARIFKNFIDYTFPRPEDQTFKHYYLQFLAHAVQRPGVKIATALLFVSEKYGIGKTTAAFEIPALVVGVANARQVPNDILERPFTGYLGEAHLVNLQEVHVNGHWNASAIANRLKGIVTDSQVNVHKKGQDDYDIPNRVIVTATSNFHDAMYITSNLDRRWGVYEMQPQRGYTQAEHDRYFELLNKFLKSPRASGVLRYIFRRVNLAGFNPQSPPPATLAKDRMAQLSLSDEEQILQDGMAAHISPFHRDVIYLEDARLFLHSETSKTYSSQRVKKWLSKVTSGITQIKTVRGSKGRIYAIRNNSQWETAAPQDILNELAR